MSRELLALSVFLIFLSAGVSRAQRDEIGAGRGLQFDGVNDRIDLGNRYDNLTLPVTISAWIKLDPAAVNNWAPIIITQDNAPVYNGIWFIVQPTRMGIGYGDGEGEFVPAFRRGKEADMTNITNRWVHVAAVVRGAVDMTLYVNGINVGGTYSGSSNLPMASSPTDVARIGQWTSNGQTIRFKGMMDELRIWSRALGDTEIRQTMCLKTVSGNGLLGQWSFNEMSGLTAFDDSPNQFNGQLMNNVTRGYSGAPIGDVSLFNYSVTSSTSVKLQEGNEYIIVDNMIGASGVQLYAVRTMPSRVDGLPLSCVDEPYFGAFVFGQFTSNVTYDLEYTSPGPVGLFTRTNNEVASWTKATTVPTGPNSISRNGLTTPVETLDQLFSLDPDLGPDVLKCSDATVQISSGISDPGVQHLWNTGAQTPAIVVANTGIYWVDVTASCGTARDSIIVGALARPAVPFIGGDTLVCDGGPAKIESAIKDATAYHWSTGATTSSITVSQPGIYWLDLTKCGTSRDTVVVNTMQPPAIAFEEEELCSSTPVVLKPVSETGYESLQWQDGSESDSLLASTSGMYRVTAINKCGTSTDSIKVSINDVEFAPPNVVTPNGDGKNDTFVIDANVGVVKLTIVNRWGQEVFATSDYKNDWSGQGASEGVYYYILTHGCSTNAVKGSLTLMR